jgi:hypothetical protein
MKPITTKLPSSILGALILAMISSAKSFAADAAQGTFTAQSLGGGVYDYTISLANTGTNNLETFWFSWVPGEDFMPVSPTNIVSPTNWTAKITGGGATDGFAIQWVTSGASAAPLAPGSTLNFSFDSTMTPAVLSGDSPDFPTTPTGTSFVYSGAPFSDSGFEFVVEGVPEPSTFSLAVISLTLFAGVFALRKKTSNLPS